MIKDSTWYKCWVNDTILTVKEIARQYRNDILKIPVHTLEKGRKSHSKTPEEMRLICANAFNDFIIEIQNGTKTCNDTKNK
jgi:hypothetical protein